MSQIYFLVMGLAHMISDFVPGAMLVIMPYMKSLMNLNYTQATIIFLVIELTSSFAQLMFGSMIDRRNGALWLMPAGILLAISGLAVVGFVNNYYLLLFLVFIIGIGVAAFHPQGSRVTYLLSAKQKQVSAMSIFSIGGTVGMGIAPVIVAWLISSMSLKATPVFLIPGIVMCWALTPVLKKVRTAPQPGNRVNRPDGATRKIEYKTMVMLLLFVIFRSWIYSGVLNFIPLYYIDYLGASTIYGSQLLTSFLISGGIGMLVAGPLADRYGLKKVLLFSTLVSAVFIYLLFSVGGNWAIAFSILAGSSLLCTVGVTIVFGQRVLSNNIGLASSLMQGVGSGLGALGATMLGYVADLSSIVVALRILSILPILALALVFFLPEASSAKSGQPVLEA